jgi:RNA polymerase sigma-70 factor (family 1)
MRAVMGNEKWIISEISIGNRHAFTELYQFYHKKVYGYALSIVNEEFLAQEVVQDVFMKIWIRRNTLLSIDNFAGYLAVCTRNETLNAIKKIAAQQKHYQVVQKTQTELDEGTEQQIQLRETRKMLDRAIQRLPPQQKKVYSLLNVQGLKLDDVAERMHITPSTTKTHLKAAIKNIRNFMDVYYRTLGIIIFIFHKIF